MLSLGHLNHLTVPRLDQDCQEELTSGPRTLPNGQRISGERRAEGDERVRCMRVLGDGRTHFMPGPVRPTTYPTGALHEPRDLASREKEGQLP